MSQLFLIWRTISRDRIFFYLLILVILSLTIAIINRTAGLEQSSLALTLVLLFFSVNGLFAFLTLRREPLLAYMFLTATFILDCTLFFYYRYLQLFQIG